MFVKRAGNVCCGTKSARKTQGHVPVPSDHGVDSTLALRGEETCQGEGCPPIKIPSSAVFNSILAVLEHSTRCPTDLPFRQWW
jgi:hypothetical protein